MSPCVGAGTFNRCAVRIVDPCDARRTLRDPARCCGTNPENRAAGGRVIAVGTTVIRTLEAAAVGGTLTAGTGSTRLFITPGYSFQVVDALVTNFICPVDLMMLVCAFGGFEPVMQAYAEAVKERYRFFSYGDAMFIELMFEVLPKTGRRGAAN